ncbi:MAG: cytochrome C oxidase subunit II [Cyanobium sp. CACIAM 14]|nr:MAG: cytochrome C oxidase subunit II [Cyanobium sp. CACIAM 14]
MNSIFADLKNRVLAAERDPAVDTGPAAVALLRDWLATHEATVSAAKVAEPTEFNGTMMQWFHWYSDADGGHWRRLKEEAPALAKAGLTALWLPPACKGGSQWDVGYGIYDLFDLGEFDQKGTVRTRWGTRDEYIAAVKACQDAGLQVYADVVFNHKMNADNQEDYPATPFDPADRNRPLGEERTIRSWTLFRFDGRGGRHSTMQWHWYHFDAVDYNSLDPDYRAIWRSHGAGFEHNVDLEKGNFDYLMGCDLNVSHPEVRGELKYWGKWTLETVSVDGFRLDAIKHIASDFYLDWVTELEEHVRRNIFVVGEYWSYNLESLNWYAANTGGHMSLFDAPLHLNFHQASRSGGNYDMSRLLDGTLMQHMPLLAVTLVENHDTQPLQSLESVVEPWFKPLAYAVILLRDQGYPCIFHADYYGAHYSDNKGGTTYEIWMPSHRFLIDRFLLARGHCAYGPQYDYLDHFNTIGWTRLGTPGHPRAMAVLMSDGAAGNKWMEVARRNTVFRDLTGHIREPITTNGDGWAEWRCPGGSVSVWVEEAVLPEMGVTL